MTEVAETRCQTYQTCGRTLPWRHSPPPLSDLPAEPAPSLQPRQSHSLLLSVALTAADGTGPGGNSWISKSKHTCTLKPNANDYNRQGTNILRNNCVNWCLCVFSGFLIASCLWFRWFISWKRSRFHFPMHFSNCQTKGWNMIQVLAVAQQMKHFVLGVTYNAVIFCTGGPLSAKDLACNPHRP